MTECEICYNNTLNEDLKCKVCSKCICSKCCMNIKDTKIGIDETTNKMNICYKCPYCRDDAELKNIEEKHLCLEITKKMIEENKILKEQAAKQDKIIMQQKNKLDNLNETKNQHILKEVKRYLYIQQDLKRRTLKTDILENILNNKATFIF